MKKLLRKTRTTRVSNTKHHRADATTLRELGALIVRRRQEQGKTAEDLARDLDICPSSLSRIENGSREIRLEILKRLCLSLKMWDDVLRFLRGGSFTPVG